MVFICWQQWHTGLLAHLANNGELVMQLTQCDPRTMHPRMVYNGVKDGTQGGAEGGTQGDPQDIPQYTTAPSMPTSGVLSGNL